MISHQISQGDNRFLPHISPYSYCAGNPVRFVDPSGMVIVYKGSTEDKEYSAELISKLREHKIFDIVFSTIDTYKKLLSCANKSPKIFAYSADG